MAKLLILLGGLAGLVALFVPLYDGDHEGQRIRVTPLHLIRGIDPASDATNAPTATTEEILDIENERFAPLFFAPGVLLLVVGVIAAARRLGLGLAVVALVCGTATFGVWMLFNDQLSETDAPLDRGLAMTFLLAAGISGTIGGLVGLWRPDPRRVDAPAPEAP